MKTQPVRIRDDDWDWLIRNRGAGSVPDKVHELVEKAKMQATTPTPHTS